MFRKLSSTGHTMVLDMWAVLGMLGSSDTLVPFLGRSYTLPIDHLETSPPTWIVIPQYLLLEAGLFFLLCWLSSYCYFCCLVRISWYWPGDYYGQLYSLASSIFSIVWVHLFNFSMNLITEPYTGMFSDFIQPFVYFWFLNSSGFHRLFVRFCPVRKSKIAVLDCHV